MGWSNKVKPYNYAVHTNDAITKHMLSDMKWYDWLTGQVVAVGRCYGLALELQNVPSEMASNFSVLNHRLAKFGIGNDYGLFHRITYGLLLMITV